MAAFQVPWQGWLTLAVVFLMVTALIREWFAPDVIMASALGILLATGVLTPHDAVAGFANQGLLTIAALFVVAKAVQESGGLASGVFKILGTAKGLTGALVRLMLPTVGISAFLNNTPVVVMFVPVVRTWAIRYDISPSKLLIPLSYASILGGMCTLIGTSTNLVVSGMMVDHGFEPMGMFEISKVGVPAAVMGVLFMLTIGHRLLPDRQDVTKRLFEEKREYLVEMVVAEGCALVGKTIEQAGLRHLKGLFLVHIERAGGLVGPVPPTEILQLGDHLRFTGIVSTIVDLKAIKGLLPVEAATLDLPGENKSGDLRLFEVVVAPSSPLVGMNVRDAGFRTRYDAAVIAVHRAGQRIVAKIGDIVLKPGDTLMLEAPDGFARRWYNSTHFYLVSRVGEVKRVKHEKAPHVGVILLLMILLPAFGVIPMVVSSFVAAALLVVMGVVSPGSARRSVDLSLLIVIASALGVGKAIEQTGLAALLANGVVTLGSQLGPPAVLAGLMLLTNVFTEIITNKAAAAVFFPVALSAAEQLHTDPRPFLLSVAVAAAASFATPMGYQTNLIVYGPGGYKYTDFLRVGTLMNLIVISSAGFAFWYWWGV